MLLILKHIESTSIGIHHSYFSSMWSTLVSIIFALRYTKDKRYDFSVVVGYQLVDNFEWSVINIPRHYWVLQIREPVIDVDLLFNINWTAALRSICIFRAIILIIICLPVSLTLIILCQTILLLLLLSIIVKLRKINDFLKFDLILEEVSIVQRYPSEILALDLLVLCTQLINDFLLTSNFSSSSTVDVIKRNFLILIMVVILHILVLVLTNLCVILLILISYPVLNLHNNILRNFVVLLVILNLFGLIDIFVINFNRLILFFLNLRRSISEINFINKTFFFLLNIFITIRIILRFVCGI